MMNAKSFLKIEVAKDEKARWCQKAREAGISLAQWVRQKLNDSKS